jgi:hypothetical protein
LVNKTDSAVELDTKTDGWLSKALGAQGSVKATVKQSREVESGRRDTSAVKVNVRVPDRQTGYRAEVTFRFDFGFRFHWTADGFQWECENVAVPVEATQWHCAYLAQTPDLSACHRAFDRDARDNLTPMVRQWVDDELQRLMSASNV